MMAERQDVFSCPDCEREGVDFLHPLSDFYVFKVREYKNDEHWVKYKGGMRRSTYCRRHTDARTAARLRARLDPTSPTYDPALHARQKGAKLSWARRTYNPESPEYDPAAHERKLQSNRTYRSNKKRQQQP